MFLSRTYHRAQSVYREYPRQFWVVVGANFVDRIGGALIFPFFSLYITRRFEVGMTEVGILFFLFSITDLMGNMLGGALTDFIGRKRVIIIGLVVSGLTSLGMALMSTIEWFYVMGVISGLFATASGPAHQAMLTDLLPEDKRADGFGVMRVAANLAVAIGPAIGGFVAAYSYLVLFAADTITSLITAAIVYVVVDETAPVRDSDQEQSSLRETFKGYRMVLQDRMFIIFVVISTLGTIVYTQMYSTLSVYLRDVHGVPEAGYGWLMTLNAGMVVLFQFMITRRISKFPPMVVMAFGSLLYVLGFGLYGFVSVYALFMIAMAVITIGEMVVVPVSQSYVGEVAPKNMRGRYMGVMGFSWMIPGMIGPLAAGLIMDNYNPNWVWYGCAVLGTISMLGFLWLDRQHRQKSPVVDYTPESVLA